jgi:galacturan 1,4-alpha-galacturonidase
MSHPSTVLLKLLAVFLLFSTLVKSDSCPGEHRKVCTVRPSQDGSNDAPAILHAFKDCGKNGRVEFLNETYHIESIMNITGLKDVEIDLKGTCQDISSSKV